MKKKADWIVEVSRIIIAGNNNRPHVFCLKNKTEINAGIFFYNHSIVHGTDDKGNDFKFNVSDLTKVIPKKGGIYSPKKPGKIKGRKRFNPTTISPKPEENEEGPKEILKNPFNQAFSTGTDTNACY